jgi:hypothetical protein
MTNPIDPSKTNGLSPPTNKEIPMNTRLTTLGFNLSSNDPHLLEAEAVDAQNQTWWINVDVKSHDATLTSE